MIVIVNEEFTKWIPVSKLAIHRWIKEFRGITDICREKKLRKIIAIDETVIKANRESYYVYAAIDIEKRINLNESFYFWKLSDY